MSLYIMTGNEEFLLNNELDLFQEIIHAGKEESKSDVWLTSQISENQDRNDVSNQIGGSIG